jgi:hypothetical protein
MDWSSAIAVIGMVRAATIIEMMKMRFIAFLLLQYRVLETTLAGVQDTLEMFSIGLLANALRLTPEQLPCHDVVILEMAAMPRFEGVRGLVRGLAKVFGSEQGRCEMTQRRQACLRHTCDSPLAAPRPRSALPRGGKTAWRWNAGARS